MSEQDPQIIFDNFIQNLKNEFNAKLGVAEGLIRDANMTTIDKLVMAISKADQKITELTITNTELAKEIEQLKSKS